MIDRPEYLKKLFSFKDMGLIKIITGVRRSGKSTLFDLYQAELLGQGIEQDQIQNINLEDLANEQLKEYHKLYEHITAHLAAGKKNYVFLDEIQVVPNFGKVVDSLFLKKNIDIYLTGSNSRIQSKDIANQIERQYITIPMFPLSFKEYVSAYPFNGSVDEIYARYLEYGSFPKVLDLMGPDLAEPGSGAKSQIRMYLSDLYDKIVLKDIVERKKIADTGRLTSVIRFIADTIGSETSINNISKTMTADGRKIDTHTLENYLNAFCDSFVLYKADRYDVKGKTILKTLNKYYLVDMGLRCLLLGDKKTGTGHMLENIVYLELLRRGYSVYIGKVGEKEVDFVAEGSGGTEYYQVSETVRGRETLAREIAPLEAIKNHNPKFLLTRDHEPQIFHNGIKQLNALEWLLNR